MFATANWEELTRQGYTVVAGTIDPALLQAAQDAAQRLNEVYPDGGWELTPKELWREVRVCRNSDFMAIASTALDSLAVEILQQGDRVLSGDARQILELADTKLGVLRLQILHILDQLIHRASVHDDLVVDLHQLVFLQQQLNDFPRRIAIELQCVD